jgi:hypothetical protein
MEQTPKQRSPQISSTLKEVENEYLEYTKDRIGTIMIANKMKSFIKQASDKITNKCSNEIKIIEQLAEIQKEADGQIKIAYKPGKEKEGSAALENLLSCEKEFTNLNASIQLLNKNDLNILSQSTEYCIDDCEKSHQIENIPQIKNCFRNCYDFSFNYTLRAIENSLSNQIDLGLEELKKL